MLTIKDIAAMANVSIGTVDRALNNKPGIKHETREKILRIANALNYEPNKMGRALASRNKIKLGFILEPIINPFFGEIKSGAEKCIKELEQYGTSTDVYVMNTYAEAEQLEMIRALRNAGVGGIALTAIDSDRVRDEINSCLSNGIKIVTCCTDIMQCARACFVGTDHKKSGRVSADLLGKMVGEKGEFIIVIGHDYIDAQRQRVEGFRTKIQEDYPSIQIKEVLKIYEDDKLALSETMKCLDKNTNINGIYIAGNGIVGVANAVKILNKRNSIRVICYDYAPYTVDFVKEGIIDIVVGQKPIKQGYLSLRILHDMLFFNKYPSKENIYTDIDIRTGENIDDMYGDQDTMEYSL